MNQVDDGQEISSLFQATAQFKLKIEEEKNQNQIVCALQAK